MKQSFVTTKPSAFFDGYERMMGMIRRHGWSKAREMFMEQYTNEWKPSKDDSWHHSQGMMEALKATM